jgi:hypothetical protein
MCIFSIPITDVLWVYVTSEKKQCFIHKKNMLRVNYTTKNTSEKPITKLTFHCCKLNMVHKQYFVTKNVALETPVSWENRQWLFEFGFTLDILDILKVNTWFVSIGSGLTYMPLSVQIYICHLLRLMHFSMEKYAVQNCIPPKFNTGGGECP